MKFLILNTCGAEGGAALAAAEAGAGPMRVVAQRGLARGTYASALMIAVREVLEESGVPLKSVDAIVVMRGPGSFTGIRVGLSAAKGLAQPSGVPVIALSQLAVMAFATGITDGQIFVAMDAGRGEFYFGEYVDAGAICVEERLASLHDMKARAGAGKIFVCESSAAEKLSGELDFHLMPQPTAELCLPLAERAFARGDFAPLAELDANYLRMVDAERTLKVGQKE